MVFSLNTKMEIWDRAEGKSELNPNLEGFRLETAHISHQRNSNYNLPSNGLLVTSLEHYAHHLLHLKNPEKIGLNRHHNEFAIRETCKRAEQDAQNLGWDVVKFNTELREAGNRWAVRLGNRIDQEA